MYVLIAAALCTDLDLILAGFDSSKCFVAITKQSRMRNGEKMEGSKIRFHLWTDPARVINQKMKSESGRWNCRKLLPIYSSSMSKRFFIVRWSFFPKVEREKSCFCRIWKMEKVFHDQKGLKKEEERKILQPQKPKDIFIRENLTYEVKLHP